MLGLHNVIFGSGGAALAQIHLFPKAQAVRPPPTFRHIFRSIEVSIPGCHAGDPGSIPGGRVFPKGFGEFVALEKC